jgi:hypothetical protein
MSIENLNVMEKANRYEIYKQQEKENRFDSSVGRHKQRCMGRELIMKQIL